ncbi:hypothetical protein VTN00DRAFT_4283 [Thermoascus crustaceus]|uniref:uncharacterized protein n=1 Tax=Thermoascus crustaceus TaxID=5088 RepID=UPI003742DC52
MYWSYFHQTADVDMGATAEDSGHGGWGAARPARRWSHREPRNAVALESRPAKPFGAGCGPSRRRRQPVLKATSVIGPASGASPYRLRIDTRRPRPIEALGVGLRGPSWRGDRGQRYSPYPSPVQSRCDGQMALHATVSPMLPLSLPHIALFLLHMYATLYPGLL